MLPTETAWPWMLLAAIVAVSLLIAYSRTQRKGYLLGTVIAVLAVGVSWVIDEAVVTPSEQVRLAVTDVLQAFRDHDFPRLEGRISDQAPQLQRLARDSSEQVVVESMRVTDVSVKMLAADARAQTRFRVNATIRHKQMGAGMHEPTMWDVKWQQEPGGWKLYEVQQLDPITQKPRDLVGIPR